MTLPEPWLIVAAWPTPHGPFTPAPWAEGTMSNIFPSRTIPNYNASSQYNQQKHWFLRQLPPISDAIADQVDKYYQRRLESLKSIDQNVAELIDVLTNITTTTTTKTGPTTAATDSTFTNSDIDTTTTTNAFTDTSDDSLMNRTVVLYTSDNGFQFGQHRMSMDKRHLYEHDIRIPMVMRGPTIRRNVTCTAMVATIDIGPTILELIGINTIDADSSIDEKTDDDDNDNDAVSVMDGQSFWQLITVQTINDDQEGSSPKGIQNPIRRTDMLISYNGEGSSPCGLSQCPYPWNDEVSWMPDSWNNTYHCVRTLESSWEKDEVVIVEDSDHNQNDDRIRATTSTTTTTTTKTMGENSIFCIFEDDESFVEYYDLNTNPYQLDNDFFQLDLVQQLRYRTRLQELLNCVGTNCQSGR